MTEEAGPVRGPQPQTSNTDTAKLRFKSLPPTEQPTEAQLCLAGKLGVILKPGDTKVDLYHRIGHVLALINQEAERRALEWSARCRA